MDDEDVIDWGDGAVDEEQEAMVAMEEAAKELTPAPTTAAPAPVEEQVTEAKAAQEPAQQQTDTSGAEKSASEPAVSAKASTTAATPSDLPAGWRERVARSGETYYYNKYTGDSSWDRPTEPATKVSSAASSTRAASETKSEAKGSSDAKVSDVPKGIQIRGLASKATVEDGAKADKQDATAAPKRGTDNGRPSKTKDEQQNKRRRSASPHRASTEKAPYDEKKDKRRDSKTSTPNPASGRPGEPRQDASQQRPSWGRDRSIASRAAAMDLGPRQMPSPHGWGPQGGPGRADGYFPHRSDGYGPSTPGGYGPGAPAGYGPPTPNDAYGPRYESGRPPAADRATGFDPHLRQHPSESGRQRGPADMGPGGRGGPPAEWGSSRREDVRSAPARKELFDNRGPPQGRAESEKKREPANGRDSRASQRDSQGWGSSGDHEPERDSQGWGDDEDKVIGRRTTRPAQSAPPAEPRNTDNGRAGDKASAQDVARSTAKAARTHEADKSSSRALEGPARWPDRRGSAKQENGYERDRDQGRRPPQQQGDEQRRNGGDQRGAYADRAPAGPYAGRQRPTPEQEQLAKAEQQLRAREEEVARRERELGMRRW